MEKKKTEKTAKKASGGDFTAAVLSKRQTIIGHGSFPSEERNIFMKRIAAFTLALTVIFGGAAYLPCAVDSGAIVAHAENSTGAFVINEFGNGTCSIKKCVSPNTENIVIPETIFGNTVVEIDENAFMFHKNMKTVVIPDTVKIIHEGAFYSCYELTSVQMSKNVEVLEDQAFFDCTKLSCINIPSSVMYIGRICFANTALKNVTIPSTQTVLGSELFSGCKDLETLVLPSKLDSIPQSMCYDCPKLRSVTIPDGLCYISDGAFRGCTGLKSLTIPASVQNVGYYAIGFDINTQKVSGFTARVTAGTAGETYVKQNGLNYVYAGGSSGGAGDVNSDGKVNVTDVSKTAAHVKGIKSLDSAGKSKADVNGDGKVNVTDVSKIAAQVKGIKKL